MVYASSHVVVSIDAALRIAIMQNNLRLVQMLVADVQKHAACFTLAHLVKMWDTCTRAVGFNRVRVSTRAVGFNHDFEKERTKREVLRLLLLTAPLHPPVHAYDNENEVEMYYDFVEEHFTEMRALKLLRCKLPDDVLRYVVAPFLTFLLPVADNYKLCRREHAGTQQYTYTASWLSESCRDIETQTEYNKNFRKCKIV